MNPTFPPADHPLRGYAEYMANRVDDLNITLLVLVVALCLLALAFAAFAVLKYQERQEIRRWRQDVTDLCAACQTLLLSVKGWTVVHVAGEKEKTEEIRKVATELQTTLPGATADKVVERIEERKAADSGTLPQVRKGPDS